jgi:hypothetical protein
MDDPIEFLIGLVVAVFMAVGTAFWYAYKSTVWAAGKVVKLFRRSSSDLPPPTVNTLLNRSLASTDDRAAMPTQIPATLNSRVATRDESLVKGLQKIADRHVCIQFNACFSASVSLYRQDARASRKIRATSNAAGILMRSLYLRESFDLPDVSLENGVSFDDVVVDTETQGMRFIEDLLSNSGAGYFSETKLPSRVTDSKDQQAPADMEATARALAILRGEMAAVQPGNLADSVAEVGKTEIQPAQQRSSRKPNGVTTGRVVEYGMRKLLFSSGGESFEATLECRGGDFVSFRGVRLQEKFVEHQVQIGDEVEIHSLGKTQVGEKKSRNEYEVKVLERTKT